MEYKSINQITEELKMRISPEITVKDVQTKLRKAGYINRDNLPTIKATDYIEAYDMRGRKYYKWGQDIVNEIGDELFEKFWK